MATESHCGASLISITFCISRSYCHRNMVQTCTSWDILVFSERCRSGKRQTQRKCHASQRQAQPAWSTGLRASPEEAEQQIRSVGVAEFLPLLKPLFLCTGVCQPTCNLAGGRTCGSPGCTYFFNAFYLHKKNHAVRSGAAKASINIVSCRIIIRKQSSPKNLSRLRLLTPEYCSCVFTFALPYFSSTRSGWLSSARGDSRVAGVPHSLLDVCSSVPLRPTGIVRSAHMHRGTAFYPEFGMTTLDMQHVGGRAEAYISEKTCRRSFEKVQPNE